MIEVDAVVAIWQQPTINCEAVRAKCGRDDGRGIITVGIDGDGHIGIELRAHDYEAKIDVAFFAGSDAFVGYVA